MNIDEVKDFDNRWNDIYTNGIDLILNKAEKEDYTNIKLDVFSLLYSKVTEILLMKSITVPGKLNDKLEYVIKKYTIDKARRLFEDISLTETKSLLFEFAKFWKIYNDIIMKMILKVFTPLTNVNTKLKRNSSLKATFLKIIKEDIFDKLKANLLDELLSRLISVKNEESYIKSKTITYLSDFISFLLILPISPQENFYDMEIEKNIVSHIIEFNRTTVSELISTTTDLVDYLEKGLLIISENINLYSNILPSKTIQQLKQELDNLVFFNNSKLLLDEKLYKVFHSKNLDFIELVYGIFKDDKVNSLPHFISVFKLFIKEEFDKLIAYYEVHKPCLTSKELAYNSEYLQDFQKFFNLKQKILTNAFSNNNSLKLALYEVIDRIQIEFPKYNNSYILPYYIDKYMNSLYNLNINKEDIESNTISLINNLFNTLPEKDIFLEQYRKILSNRLLLNESIDIQLEVDIIETIQTIGGENFTSNLVSMIDDCKQSTEFTKALCNENSSLINKINVFLLSSDKWPKMEYKPLTLSNDFDMYVKITNTLFISKYPNRNIHFIHDKSYVELNGKFNKRSFTFRLNNFQACILLMFNQYVMLKKSEIINKTNITETDFAINITILMNERILIKNTDETYLLNQSYDSSLNYVKLCFDESLHEIKSEKVEDDRSYAIEAAIVRIMKRKLKIQHEDLVNEVNNEIYMFKVNNDIFKKKLNNLIEREIILRDTNEIETYKYNY